MRQRSQHSPGGFHRKGLHIALGWDGGQQSREAEFGRVSRHWTSKRTEKDLFVGSGDRGRCLGPAWAPGGVGCWGPAGLAGPCAQGALSLLSWGGESYGTGAVCVLWERGVVGVHHSCMVRLEVERWEHGPPSVSMPFPRLPNWGTLMVAIKTKPNPNKTLAQRVDLVLIIHQ